MRGSSITSLSEDAGECLSPARGKLARSVDCLPEDPLSLSSMVTHSLFSSCFHSVMKTRVCSVWIYTFISWEGRAFQCDPRYQQGVEDHGCYRFLDMGHRPAASAASGGVLLAAGWLSTVHSAQPSSCTPLSGMSCSMHCTLACSSLCSGTGFCTGHAVGLVHPEPSFMCLVSFAVPAAHTAFVKMAEGVGSLS